MNGHSEDYSEQCEIKENGQVETNGIKIWRLVLTGKNLKIVRLLLTHYSRVGVKNILCSSILCAVLKCRSSAF